MVPVVGGLWVLVVAALPLIIQVLVSLGIGVVVYTGVDFALDEAYQYIVSQTNALTGDLLAFFAIMNLDKYITMIFGAYSAKMAVKGMTASGSISKWNFKGLPE